MNKSNKSTIKYTNRTRLGFFRNVTTVGSLELEPKSLLLENQRIIESKYYTNSIDIKNTTDSISEIEFYIMYLTMVSTANKLVNGFKEGKVNKPVLTPTHITYLATLMSKPLDYTISTNSKSNKITEIAEELGKTSQSFYSALHKLKKDKWLYITEDSNIKLVNSLENLRKMIKGQLELNNNTAIWDSLFRFIIQN